MDFADAGRHGFPTADALAALRTWYAGMNSSKAVARYLPEPAATGRSARSLITRIRKQLQAFARSRRLHDVVDLLEHPASERMQRASQVAYAIEALRGLPEPSAALGDPVYLWLPHRGACALQAAGIKTLADVVVCFQHRRRWWTKVPGLGEAGAKKVEKLVTDLIAQTTSATLVATQRVPDVVPLERFVVPVELDGTHGIYRAPDEVCVLSARCDVQAVEAWVSLHEAPSTRRAYRKEAERLLLWAVVEHDKALSSLTAEDAIAYRSFLRAPKPSRRWIGPPRPRTSSEWRPFEGGLSARSAAYAIAVVSALFRWLRDMNYVVANPFAGLKVRGAKASEATPKSRALTAFEWSLVRIEADLLDLRHGWSVPTAQRLRFLLDFMVATGLRPSELVGARLGDIQRNEGSTSWLNVRGKGEKGARVPLPELAVTALEKYLSERRLPVTARNWRGCIPLVPSVKHNLNGMTRSRLREVLKRFFSVATEQLRATHPGLADKLERATTHWIRHTHATLLLDSGADLKSVRDNLRHASIATTSVYIDSDDERRAQQVNAAFGLGRSNQATVKNGACRRTQ